MPVSVTDAAPFQIILAMVPEDGADVHVVAEAFLKVRGHPLGLEHHEDDVVHALLGCACKLLEEAEALVGSAHVLVVSSGLPGSSPLRNGDRQQYHGHDGKEP